MHECPEFMTASLPVFEAAIAKDLEEVVRHKELECGSKACGRPHADNLSNEKPWQTTSVHTHKNTTS